MIIIDAGKAIAKELQELSPIKRAFHYPRPLSRLDFGDLCMRIGGGSPPNTFGRNGLQTVLWECLVYLGGDTSQEIEELQLTLAKLISADPQEGIIGRLRDAEVRGRLREYGSPAVTEDGVDISYNEIAGDTLATFVQCSISSNLRIDNAP